jgi:2-methylisocitrate lyase-like PEP mutase family enzyme
MNQPRSLRRQIEEDGLIVAPGAYDPLTARIVEALGFEAVFVGGFITAAHLGSTEPFVTLTEQVAVAGRVARAVNIPVICDAGAGFGEPMHTARTVEEFEMAGIAAIHIEDQIYPKRISYFRELEHIVPLDDFLLKIEYALKARRNAEFLIIARTDAFTAQEGGRSETVRRGRALAAIGADAVMLRGVSTRDDLIYFREQIPNIPLLVIAGAKWDDLTIEDYRAIGYQIVIYATSSAASAAGAVWDNYRALKETGRLGVLGGSDEYFRQRRIIERVLDFERFMAIEAATMERGTEAVVDPFARQRSGSLE